MVELLENGRTGIHFRPGDSVDLAVKVKQLLAMPSRLDHMRRQARREFELKYTARRNYDCLMEIYRQALAAKAATGRRNGSIRGPAGSGLLWTRAEEHQK
jgi:glycosyltransferase involved in cell wall biosynthesis